MPLRLALLMVLGMAAPAWADGVLVELHGKAAPVEGATVVGVDGPTTVDGQALADGEALADAVKAAAAKPHADMKASLGVDGAAVVKVHVDSVPPGWGKRLLALELMSTEQAAVIATKRVTVDSRRVPFDAEISQITLPAKGGTLVVALRALDGKQVLGVASVEWPSAPGAAGKSR